MSLSEAEQVGQMTTYLLSCHCQANILSLTVPVPVTGKIEPMGGQTHSEGGAWDNTSAQAQAETASTVAEEPHAPGAGLDGSLVCDCSICLKHLSVFSIQPLERVKFIKGCVPDEGTLKVYMFGERKGKQCFCRICGTFLFARFQGYEAYIGLNLRAIRKPVLSVYDLTPKQSKMADVPPLYTHPSLPAEARAYLEKRQEHYKYPTEIYTGSCHCQALTFGVVAKPMKEEEVCICTCSICHGNGTIWIYPGVADIFYLTPLSASAPHIPSPELVTRYTFGPGPEHNQHVFCKTCGIQVFETYGADLGSRAEGERGYRDTQVDCQLGINVATLNNAHEWLSDGRGREMGWVVDDEAIGRLPLYELKI